MLREAQCEICHKIYHYRDGSPIVEGNFVCSSFCATKLKPKKNKYRAKKCVSDGKKFPSLLERNCYNVLKSLQEKGHIHFFLRQVPFDLPGGSIHRVDFAVFCDHNVFFLEAKGKDLAMGKLKRKQVIDIYNIDVFVVKNPAEIQLILEGEI